MSDNEFKERLDESIVNKIQIDMANSLPEDQCNKIFVRRKGKMVKLGSLDDLRQLKGIDATEHREEN